MKDPQNDGFPELKLFVSAHTCHFSVHMSHIEATALSKLCLELKDIGTLLGCCSESDNVVYLVLFFKAK